MNTPSPQSVPDVMTCIKTSCDLAHSRLTIELFCREMDQPLTRPPCFPLAGFVLLSAMNGVGLLGVGCIHNDRHDKPGG